MALTNEEQRTLDEIERALRDGDPAFVNAVDFNHLRRHRVIVGGLVFLLGLIVLVVGEVAAQTQLLVGVIVGVGVVGFVTMFAAIAWTLSSPRSD